jgi:hypothetical protein
MNSTTYISRVEPFITAVEQRIWTNYRIVHEGRVGAAEHR